MTSRCFALALLVAGLGGSAVFAQGSEAPAPQGKATLVYIGTHTDKGKGIYFFRLQSAGTDVFQNVTLVPLGVAAETPNPTSFEIDPKRRLLFTVNEIEQFEGKPGGSVSAYSIDGVGKLTLINQRPSMGSRPCQLTTTADGKHILVVNCGDGTVAVLPVAADGQLGVATDATKGTRATCAATDPAGKFVFVCESAGDRVLAYQLDGATGKLRAREPAATPLKAGAAPRQIGFRSDAQFAYVLNEKDSTVTTFAYDATSGALKEIQTVRTLPEYFDGPNMALDLRVHPSGKFLFVANHGHDSIVLFNIDKEKGTLSFVEEQGTGGRHPRQFGIQTSGGHMAISLPETSQVLASRIDDGNGRLKPSGVFADVPSPAAIRFLPPAEGADTAKPAQGYTPANP
jgi:6-phosphogluconolactonase